MTRTDRLTALLQAALSPQLLEITDESDRHAGHAEAGSKGETHYRMRICSTRLTGLSRVEQHRMIYDIINQELKDGLHAISIKVE